MYELIDINGTKVSEYRSFMEAKTAADSNPGYSVYYPDKSQIIYTFTNGGRVNPTFNISTFKHKDTESLNTPERFEFEQREQINALPEANPAINEAELEAKLAEVLKDEEQILRVLPDKPPIESPIPEPMAGNPPAGALGKSDHPYFGYNEWFNFVGTAEEFTQFFELNPHLRNRDSNNKLFKDSVLKGGAQYVTPTPTPEPTPTPTPEPTPTPTPEPEPTYKYHYARIPGGRDGWFTDAVRKSEEDGDRSGLGFQLPSWMRSGPKVEWYDFGLDPDGKSWDMSNLKGGGGSGDGGGDGSAITIADIALMMKTPSDQTMGHTAWTPTEAEKQLTLWADENKIALDKAYSLLFDELGESIYTDPIYGAWATGVKSGNDPIYDPVSTTSDLTNEQSQQQSSRSYRGRQDLFNRYAATQGLGGKTDRAKEIFHSKFNPLSARFALDNVLEDFSAVANSSGTARPFSLNGISENPSTISDNFRQFLGSGPNIAIPLDQQGFQDRFDKIADLYSLESPSVDQETRKEALQGDTALNIMIQAIGAGTNPFLRDGISDIVKQRVLAFEDKNPEKDIFSEFVRRGFTF